MSKPPFQSFSFTLIENKRPRASFRLALAEDGLYELRVQTGSATNPSSQFTRKTPLEIAERLRDALQEIGVFGWEESYGDATSPGSRRWAIATVFQEGVFSVESKGGSDVPRGFDEMLEELYRLDFPRPNGGRETGARTPMGGMSVGDLGAYASMGQGGVDFARLADMMKGSGLPGMDASSLNPQEIEQRLKEEFRHLLPDQQSQMLDALASTGYASREWWKRFFGLL